MLRVLALALVRLYQIAVSPVLALVGARCRYYPTCSEYTSQALHKYDLSVALGKSVVRLMRCRPACAGGVDLP